MNGRSQTSLSASCIHRVATATRAATHPPGQQSTQACQSIAIFSLDVNTIDMYLSIYLAVILFGLCAVLAAPPLEDTALMRRELAMVR